MIIYTNGLGRAARLRRPRVRPLRDTPARARAHTHTHTPSGAASTGRSGSLPALCHPLLPRLPCTTSLLETASGRRISVFAARKRTSLLGVCVCVCARARVCVQPGREKEPARGQEAGRFPGPAAGRRPGAVARRCGPCRASRPGEARRGGQNALMRRGS